MFIQHLFTIPFPLALAYVLGLVIGITIHEFSHAWVAYRLGDDTPYLQGRVTLNPLAHFDPIGTIMLLLLGFGWGKPVIYNPLRLKRRVDELLIALAGPASNLLLALILNAMAYFLARYNLLHLDILHPIADFNILLASFNLLPLPPLDGSSIIAYFWPPYRSILGGQIGLIVLLIVIFLPIPGYGNLINIFLAPVDLFFTNLTHLFGLL